MKDNQDSGTKIILLNGPPGSGKDTLADYMKDYAPSIVHTEKVAWPIKALAPYYIQVMYGLDPSDWKVKYDTPATKDTKLPEFHGASPRDVQIAIGNMLKQLHGDDIFGRLLVSRLAALPVQSPPNRVVVVSDSGFVGEAEAVIKHFGAASTFLVRLHRNGHTFALDSRGHINLDHAEVRSLDFDNCSGVYDYARFGGLLVEAVVAPRETLHDEFRNPEPDRVYQERVSKNWAVLIEAWRAGCGQPGWGFVEKEEG